MPLRRRSAPATPSVPAPQDEGVNPAVGVLGVGALVGAGLLARKPGLLGKGLSKANALRQQLMLSGLAVPKSLLGGAGAALERGIETKSLRPLKELFSPQTIREFTDAYKTGGYVGPTPGVGTAELPKAFNLPGRILGAGDVASRRALERAGATATESQAALLQKPLPKGFEALESDIGRFVVPFRRTPINQFLSGFEKIKRAREGEAAARRGLAVYGTAGAIHGAATADEKYPTSVPLATAASARYGVPYGLAALFGRGLAGGRGGGGIASSITPVSEYGIEQAATRPLAGFEPALYRLFKRRRQ